MIGHVQSGRPLDPSLANIPAPLPRFAGLDFALSPAGTGALQRAILPPFSAVDGAKFTQLFNRHVPPGHNIIGGNEARDVFLKAQLLEQVLGLVWNAVDRGAKGHLTREEFCVAMYLIQGVLKGLIKQVPQIIPDQIWNQALQALAQAQTSVILNQTTGNLLGLPESRPIPEARPINAARTVQVSHSPKVAHQLAIPESVSNTEWNITPAQKSQFDLVFDSLDKNHVGRLGPSEIAPFLMSSKLAQEDLARVWDLANVHNAETFSKTEFAISMFLVQKRLRGEALPASIPPELVASLEAKQAPPPPPPQPRQSSLNDLVDVFGSLGTSSPQSQASPVSQQPSHAPIQVHGTGSLTGSFLRRFKPTLNFGQKIIHEQEVKSSKANSLLQLDEKEEDSGDDSDLSYSYKPETKSVGTTSAGPNYNALREVQLKPTPPASRSSASSFPAPPASQPAQPPQAPASRGVDPLLVAQKNQISEQLTAEHVKMSNINALIKLVELQTQKLQSEISQLKAQLAAAQEARGNFEARLKRAQALLEEETQQYEAIKKSVVAAQRENETLRLQASSLEAEYNTHQLHYQTFQMQLTEKQNENAGFRDQVGTLTAEHNDLLTRLEQIKTSLENQITLNEMQRRQIEVLKTKKASVKEEINLESSKLKDAQDDGTKLQQEENRLKEEIEHANAVIPQNKVESGPKDTSGLLSKEIVGTAPKEVSDVTSNGVTSIATESTGGSSKDIAGSSIEDAASAPHSTSIQHPEPKSPSLPDPSIPASSSPRDSSGFDSGAAGTAVAGAAVGAAVGAVGAAVGGAVGAAGVPALSSGRSTPLTKGNPFLTRFTAPADPLMPTMDSILGEPKLPETEAKDDGLPVTPATGGESEREELDLENFREFPSQAEFESQYDDKSGTEKETGTDITKDTSDTSPPPSEFQFANGVALLFPPYGTGLRRPESLTLSVQNNAAMLVRDESVPEDDSADDAALESHANMPPPPVPVTSDEDESSSDDEGPEDVLHPRDYHREDEETRTLGANTVGTDTDTSRGTAPTESADPSHAELWFENLGTQAAYNRANLILTTTSEVFMDAHEDLSLPVTQTHRITGVINTGKPNDLFSPTLDKAGSSITQNVISSSNDASRGTASGPPGTQDTRSLTTLEAQEGTLSDFDAAFSDLKPAQVETSDVSATPKKVEDDFDAAFDDLEPVAVDEGEDLEKESRDPDFDDFGAAQGTSFDEHDFEGLTTLQEKPVEFLDDDDFGKPVKFEDDLQGFGNSKKNDDEEFDAAFNI